jgi:transposase
MRAFDPEVVDTVWTAVKALLPVHAETHPLGCHRPRAADRDCFEVMLVRLATGCSWEDAERLCGKKVSDTTARARRDEWIDAGVFEAIAEEALAAYDKIIGLHLDDLAVDGSQHKAPAGGEGTGPNCTDKGRSGWKWSIATGQDGIPVGWVLAPANTNDCKLLAETLDEVRARGLLTDVDTVHLDRGYDFPFVRQALDERHVASMIPKVRRRAKSRRRKLKVKTVLGPRWPVERTNSWLTNFGQLRRNTDRKLVHRLAQFALAVVILITAKLIDWRNRWSPGCVPIR